MKIYEVLVNGKKCKTIGVDRNDAYAQAVRMYGTGVMLTDSDSENIVGKVAKLGTIVDTIQDKSKPVLEALEGVSNDPLEMYMVLDAARLTLLIKLTDILDVPVMDLLAHKHETLVKAAMECMLENEEGLL